MRVQPHLKKCFEGIASLEFNDHQEIVGMISSENEVVPFSNKIVPAKAKVINEHFNQSISYSINGSINRSINQSINQSIIFLVTGVFSQ